MYFYLPTKNYPHLENFISQSLNSLDQSLLENSDFWDIESGYTLELTSEDSAHIISMRKKAGDVFELCNQQGVRFLSEMIATDKKKRNCTILIKKISLYNAKNSLIDKQKILFQAVLDKDYLEKFFETIAFGFFDRVYLFASDFSPNSTWINSLCTLPIDSKDHGLETESQIFGFDLFAQDAPKAAFLERLKKILIRSTEQCQKTTRVEIIFLKKESGYKLIQSIRPEVADTADKGQNNTSKDQQKAVLIGPEGGFSDREKQFFKSNGLESLSLGQVIYPGWCCHLVV